MHISFGLSLRCLEPSLLRPFLELFHHVNMLGCHRLWRRYTGPAIMIRLSVTFYLRIRLGQPNRIPRRHAEMEPRLAYQGRLCSISVMVSYSRALGEVLGPPCTTYSLCASGEWYRSTHLSFSFFPLISSSHSGLGRRILGRRFGYPPEPSIVPDK
jgi:hypothetical protein